MAVLHNIMAYVLFARRNARLKNKTMATWLLPVRGCTGQCLLAMPDLVSVFARAVEGFHVATHLAVWKLDNVYRGFRLRLCEPIQEGVYHADHVAECDELH